MKKLLIASTALVATAGMAAADITMSGYAEIGMRDAGGVVGMEMHSDMDIGFKLSGASDNGLTFGASIDLDEVSNGIASTGFADIRVKEPNTILSKYLYYIININV